MSSMDGATAQGNDSDNNSDSEMDASDDSSPDVDPSELTPSPYYTQRITKEEYARQTERTKEAVEDLVRSRDYQMWLNKCSSCHISWFDGNFTYGCEECGGFALKRPCPICDGKCQALWRRDTDMSHRMRSAYWDGECKLPVAERQACFIRNVVESNEDILTEAIQDL